MTTQAGFKTHWAVADYLQRSARHLASATDLEQAYSVGVTAVRWALEGRSGVMPGIRAWPTTPTAGTWCRCPWTRWPTARRACPRNTSPRMAGASPTPACATWPPLIGVQAPPPYERGLPQLLDPELRLREQQLPAWKGA